jgi:hypothetical protein
MAKPGASGDVRPAAGVLVNFSRFRLEKHVELALNRAWELSNNAPLEAGHLMRSASYMGVGTAYSSTAFRKVRSLLPLRPTELKRAPKPLDLAATPLVRPLAESVSVAEAFLADQGTVWGRDYVTLALLAKDPSLDEIANEAGVDLQAVRREWFEFVCSSDEHRSKEEWEKWWRAAGFAAPDQVVGSQPTAAYLLTWNPALFPFGNLDEHINAIRERGQSVFQWSTGRRRSMSPGERVFLLRQGPDPRGLVGVGEVLSEIKEQPHWDQQKRKQGKTSFLVQVSWKALSREPIIDLSRLNEETGNRDLWATQTGGVSVPPDVVERLEAMWPAAWERRLHGLEGAHFPTLDPRQLIARLKPDTGESTDSNNINRYVGAFARVIASRSLTPPLAIGLFGDWGAGKTFFMDRLEEQVQALSQEDSDASSLYWPRICQIRFNAWHYAETDLWASLVSAIFSELRQYLDGAKDDADEFNKLLQKLELAGALRKDAEKHLAATKREHKKAAKRLTDAEKALSGLPDPPQPTDEHLQKILKASIAEEAKKWAGGERPADRIAALLESAAEWSGREDLKRAADQVRGGQATVEEARLVLEESRALASRAGFWWRVLSTAKLHKTLGFWIVIVLLIAIPLGFGLFHNQLSAQFKGWTYVWAILSEGLTAIGASVAWIRSRLAGAAPVFDQLDALQATIERKVEEARNSDRAEYETRRNEARQVERDAQRKLEEARRALDETTEAERQAEVALRESTSQARLGRFIRERASSADYEKHLGLIAMIHRDFSRLSDLMRTARSSQADPELPRIDRIILYIDDLDRCYPPEKVVRVLEAVHLLLFFPLFVVVVGVDSRWLSRSLYKHYEGMLGDEAIAPAGVSGVVERAPADSQDFLEKIFHVPFWLRRMDPEAVKRMIHNQVPEDELAKPPPASLEPALIPEEEVVAEAGAQGGTEGTEEPPPAVSEPEEAGRAAAKRTMTEAEIDRESIGEPAAPPTETLTITQRELDFMDEVARLMPRTPRSVKRFVNIYRLYKAALSTPALANFLGTPERPGNHQAVQVLLALVIGAPGFARRVFSELHADGSSETKRLSDLVTALDGGEESWKTTLEALREFAQDKNDLKLDALREVSPLVTRYSVHHMVSQTPGEADVG